MEAHDDLNTSRRRFLTTASESTTAGVPLTGTQLFKDVPAVAQFVTIAGKVTGAMVVVPPLTVTPYFARPDNPVTVELGVSDVNDPPT